MLQNQKYCNVFNYISLSVPHLIEWTVIVDVVPSLSSDSPSLFACFYDCTD